MRKLAEKLEAKKSYWMGRRICKEIAVEILDNVERYMLSDMCQSIIMDTVIPRALELVGSRSARRVRQSAQKEAWIGRKACQDILSGILNSIDTIMLFNICRDILTETILPETQLRVETNSVIHMIEASTLVSLEDRVRMMLVTRRVEMEETERRMERRKRKNILELEWAVKKDERNYNELVKSMSIMEVGDRMEHIQLEELMANLSVGCMVEVEEVGPWEVEEDWLVQWLSMQDRLGLGQDGGDVCMKDIMAEGCEVIMESECWVGMPEDDTNYMEWLESELLEMEVDTDTINMVIYNEKKEIPSI